jgi:hypothetical protein
MIYKELMGKYEIEEKLKDPSKYLNLLELNEEQNQFRYIRLILSWISQKKKRRRRRKIMEYAPDISFLFYEHHKFAWCVLLFSFLIKSLNPGACILKCELTPPLIPTEPSNKEK